jgi:hypothetical protein
MWREIEPDDKIEIAVNGYRQKIAKMLERRGTENRLYLQAD